jgi:hypothetical protein
MAVAKAATRPKPLAILGLLRALGPRETLRRLRAVRAASRRVESLATESYWSRAPFELGTQAVKFKLDAAAAAAADGSGANRGPDYLREDLARRLRAGPLTFPFQAQRFVDERRTPIEDGAAE